MTTKIHVMHTGSVQIDEALAFKESSLHPAPYTGWFRPKSKRINVPVSTYLIEHPRGLILVVTGWHHVSGVKHVAEAKKILVSQLEWTAAHKNLGYIPSMWKGINISPFELQEIPAGPYHIGKDLFQDGTVYIVYTPGHSKGQISTGLN